MRYRDTGDYQNLGLPVDDGLVFVSVILGLILGAAFSYFGWRVKHYWMLVWGIGLILAALSYFVLRQLGYF